MSSADTSRLISVRISRFPEFFSIVRASVRLASAGGNPPWAQARRCRCSVSMWGAVPFHRQKVVGSMLHNQFPRRPFTGVKRIHRHRPKKLKASSNYPVLVGCSNDPGSVCWTLNALGHPSNKEKTRPLILEENGRNIPAQPWISIRQLSVASGTPVTLD